MILSNCLGLQMRDLQRDVKVPEGVQAGRLTPLPLVPGLTLSSDVASVL